MIEIDGSPLPGAVDTGLSGAYGQRIIDTRYRWLRLNRGTATHLQKWNLVVMA